MVGKLICLYKKNKEVINYLIFGILTTLINLITYFLLTNTFLDVNKVLELQCANVISWVVAVVFAYFTNRKYVFESSNTNKFKEIVNFFAARIVTLVMDMGIMYFGVNLLNLNDGICKIVSQVVVIVSNYIFSKLFVFRKKVSD